MYKLLLCLRYLRTRYIALASIISVTLGVATMIVVNSVMAGFHREMHQRLRGILSDLLVESHSMDGIPDPEPVQAQIREALGEDLVGMTANVHVPAMINFRVRDDWMTKPVNLIGIDSETYGQVGDFSQYLLHPQNREQIEFALRTDGYDSRLQDAGWSHRRRWAAYERALAREFDRLPKHASPEDADAPAAESSDPSASTAVEATADSPAEDPSWLTQDDLHSPFDEMESSPAELFDPALETHTGIVLGIGISSLRYRNAAGEVEDLFLCLPGDDVKVTVPSGGTPPQPRYANFTVIDMYESKMSEYDAGFAFVPLPALQRLRWGSGARNVTSIQIKLRPGADLDAACEKLKVCFPPHIYHYRIETWMEMQGPLFSAVQMETRILNILLFMIIAVAGFGILATFFMIVVEKTRDIGVLKSLGASSGGVMSIFLAYGFSLGAVGSGVGLVLGLLFVAHINRIAGWLEKLTGHEVFDRTVYYFYQIPTVIVPATITWIVVGALLIAVMASILPALRAARLHPVEALRYE